MINMMINIHKHPIVMDNKKEIFTQMTSTVWIRAFDVLAAKLPTARSASTSLARPSISQTGKANTATTRPSRHQSGKAHKIGRSRSQVAGRHCSHLSHFCEAAEQKGWHQVLAKIRSFKEGSGTAAAEIFFCNWQVRGSPKGWSNKSRESQCARQIGFPNHEGQGQDLCRYGGFRFVIPPVIHFSPHFPW